MSAKSTSSTVAWMPNSSARSTVSVTSAWYSSIFEGMHPRFRQVPPSGPFSTMATDSPRLTATFATSSPDPDPMTRKSYSSMLAFQPLA
jgi:hypothetical protein